MKTIKKAWKNKKTGDLLVIQEGIENVTLPEWEQVTVEIIEQRRSFGSDKHCGNCMYQWKDLKCQICVSWNLWKGGKP